MGSDHDTVDSCPRKEPLGEEDDLRPFIAIRGSLGWWAITLLSVLLALVLLSPWTFQLLSLIGLPLTYLGLPSTQLFLIMMVFYFFLSRLIWELAPVCPIDRWRGTTVSTIIALIVFCPICTRVFIGLTVGGAFALQILIFLLVLRVGLNFFSQESS
jgi:hypothetical protein